MSEFLPTAREAIPIGFRTSSAICKGVFQLVETRSETQEHSWVGNYIAFGSPISERPSAVGLDTNRISTD